MIFSTRTRMQNQGTHIPVPTQKMPASSSRILYDIPCKVCRDHSSGKHYGIFACDGCAGFFKRSIRRNRQYVCKTKSEGGCTVDKTHRNQCRACRLSKCIQVGMNRDAVQHERGPRNSTIRRQMALYFKEPEMMANMIPPSAAALDLVLPKPSIESRVSITTPPTHPTIPHPVYCNALGMSKFPVNVTSLSTVPLIPTIPTITADSICEQAARLLFLNVHWARELTRGTNLSMEDQLTLLESSWSELFLLAAAQMMPTLDPTPLLQANPQNVGLPDEVNRFRETLAGFHGMNLDQHEFACIRAIVLFKAGLDCDPVPTSRSNNDSGPLNRLRNAAAVVRLRDSAQLALGQRFTNGSYGALRFGKVLLLLPTLRSVSAHAIEDLFFKRTIGAIPIERIICDMYKG